jgi:predicted  nucleic acid-binding Zn-ribbon protein
VITRYHRALIGVGCLLALFVAFRLYVSAQVDQARSRDAVAAAKVDAIADDVAGQVAASEAAATQKGNDDARKDAAGSGDPLKSGLDSLRARTPRDPKATR